MATRLEKLEAQAKEMLDASGLQNDGIGQDGQPGSGNLVEVDDLNPNPDPVDLSQPTDKDASRENDTIEGLKQKLDSAVGRLEKMSVFQSENSLLKNELSQVRKSLEDSIHINAELMKQIENARLVIDGAKSQPVSPLSDEERQLYANEIPIIEKIAQAQFAQRGITPEMLDRVNQQSISAQKEAQQARKLLEAQDRNMKLSRVKELVPDLGDIENDPKFASWERQKHEAASLAAGRDVTVHDILINAFNQGKIEYVASIYNNYKREMGLPVNGTSDGKKKTAKDFVAPPRSKASSPPMQEKTMNIPKELAKIRELTRQQKHVEAQALMNKIYEAQARAMAS